MSSPVTPFPSSYALDTLTASSSHYNTINPSSSHSHMTVAASAKLPSTPPIPIPKVMTAAQSPAFTPLSSSSGNFSDMPHLYIHPMAKIGNDILSLLSRYSWHSASGGSLNEDQDYRSDIKNACLDLQNPEQNFIETLKTILDLPIAGFHFATFHCEIAEIIFKKIFLFEEQVKLDFAFLVIEKGLCSESDLQCLGLSARDFIKVSDAYKKKRKECEQPRIYVLSQQTKEAYAKEKAKLIQEYAAHSKSFLPQ